MRRKGAHITYALVSKYNVKYCIQQAHLLYAFKSGGERDIRP